MVMFDEFKTNENEIRTNDKIEPHLQKYLTNSL